MLQWRLECYVKSQLSPTQRKRMKIWKKDITYVGTLERIYSSIDWVFNGITFHFCRNEASPSVTTWESHRLQPAVSDVKYFSTCMRFSDLQLWNGYERSSRAVLQPLALHCATHVLCDVYCKPLILSRIAICPICSRSFSRNYIRLTDPSHLQYSNLIHLTVYLN